jgi:hypothetical protein
MNFESVSRSKKPFWFLEIENYDDIMCPVEVKLTTMAI